MTVHSEKQRVGNPVARFIADDRGSQTVEFVMMVPLVVALILVISDASLVFLRQTSLLNVSRDTARAVARHMLTEAEAKAYAEAATKTAVSSPVATVTIANNAVTVLIEADAQSSAPFGLVSFAVGDRISATAINVMEPL